MSAKASQKKMEYIANYEADNYDKVLTRLPKGYKARIQATGATVNGFIVNAVKQALDNPQPVQAPPPQPVATPATAPATAPEGVPEGYTVIPVCLPTTIVNSIDKACSAGYGPARDPYIVSAVNVQLRRDADTEKEKRRQAAIDRMYAELPPD